MAVTLSITISDGAAARLQALVNRNNQAQGTSLTVRQWVILHLRELAIAQEYAARLQALQEQHETDFLAAQEAERQALLAAIE